MNVLVILAVVGFCASGALAVAVQNHCLTDAECGSDECCFRHEGPLIVSRRRQANILPVNLASKGVCEKYQKQGSYCSSFDKLNGHCSCGHGLECRFVPAPTVTLQTAIIDPIPVVSKKRSVFFPGPGSYKCMPKA